MTRTTTGPASLERRTLLRGSVFGGAFAMTGIQAACSTSSSGGPGSAPGEDGLSPNVRKRSSSTTSDQAGRRVLLAYFSRAGENYYYGDRINLTVGNTTVLARMIRDQLDCDLHEIEAAEPYSADYDAAVARNVREQEADARPEIANPLTSIEDYDVVLLASPIWNVRPPMIMRTFAESHDFRGKTVYPVTTYAMSGLGTSEREYAEACSGADIGEGLAVQGEEVRDNEQAVTAWLQRINGTEGTSND
jgi:flavodoxin